MSAAERAASGDDPGRGGEGIIAREAAFDGADEGARSTVAGRCVAALPDSVDRPWRGREKRTVDGPTEEMRT